MGTDKHMEVETQERSAMHGFTLWVVGLSNHRYRSILFGFVSQNPGYATPPRILLPLFSYPLFVFFFHFSNTPINPATYIYDYLLCSVITLYIDLVMTYVATNYST